MGNVNVSKFGPKLAGAGGFINITQTRETTCLLRHFHTAGGLEIDVTDGKLQIVREGATRKFIDNVEHLTFSARRSLDIGQEVLYVTERAVFQLTSDGLQLIELAPGIDLESQVLNLMDFAPIVGDYRPMPLHLPDKWNKS